MRLHIIDIAVVLAYFAAVLGIGMYFARHHTTERYFLGQKNFPGWAIGLSFIGSTISSVTFIAYPADSFKTAWVRLLPNLAYPFVVILAAMLFLPLFRNGIVRSAYHYLSLRFGQGVSVYAAAVYLFAQFARATTITYLLAVLLETITGLHFGACILLATGVTAAYTVKGGFEAVVWADVLQIVVLMLGAVACIVVVVNAIDGGIGQIVREALAAGKLSFQDLNAHTNQLEPIRSGFSLTEKTALMLVLVGVAQYIAGQLDQDTVQRWCSAKSTREARKSMLVLGFGALPVWATFMFLGTCLWVYYQHFTSGVAEEILAGARKAEDILPHFITTVLPVGAAGLVIAAALAAAMGALSGSINASSMVWVNDIYRLYMARNREDSHYLRVGRIASLALAILMSMGAWVLHKTNTATIMETMIILLALTGGGISGAFLLGILTRKGNVRGVTCGIIVTITFTAYATLAQAGLAPRVFNPYYTSIIGNTLMFLTSYVASIMLSSATVDLRGLTIWDRACASTSEPVTP